MNKRKIVLILCLIIGVCSILVGSVAYYRIVVSGSIKANTGNAVFVLKDSDDSIWNNKVISLNGGNNINPGDSGSFTVKMDASGSSVDMYATLEIDRGNLPTNLKFYTTSDKKSELHKYYSFLETSNQVEELTIYWYWNPYIDDEEDNKFINQSNLEATIRVNAVQISEYAVMKNGYVRYNYHTEFWSDTYRPYIRTINFGNDLSNLPSECTEENLCWDISEDENQKNKVYGYLLDSGLKDSSDNTKALYNLYIVSEVPIFAPSSCLCMFYNFTSLVSINFNNFNTSKVIDMSTMFLDCSSLIELDLSSFNTSNVTGNIFRMFGNCSSLTELDLSNFNTSNVTSMNRMFDSCSLLTELNLSGFNTSNVEYMYQMFYYCSSLTELDLSSFNTSKVTDMSWMFNYCKSLIKLDLSSFNTSKVTDMHYMFDNCSSLNELDLSGFNTSKVTTMNYMFSCCESLTELDLSSFNTTNVTNMKGMFGACLSLTELDLSSFNTSNVEYMNDMFGGCSSLTELDLSCFNTSKVINMVWMFYRCENLTSLNLSKFNTSNVTYMDQMFDGCLSLTELDLSNFDTSNVTSMQWMFRNCSSLTTEINIMNTSVTSYANMFIDSATAAGTKITVNYIADASDLVDNMIATKSSNSNVVKGSIIPEYTITINGNDDITYERLNGCKGINVTLTSISGNNWVTSFKMNGTLIEGNTFTMPDSNVTISDITTIECATFETDHNPYLNSQSNVIIGEQTFEGATSLTVILDYETQGLYTDYFYIYDSASATTGKRYGGSTRTKETITINSNYIKITFTSNSSGNAYYGLKAIIIPNY